MGCDKRTGELTELGGGLQLDKDYNRFFEAAVRELAEESLGLLDLRANRAKYQSMAHASPAATYRRHQLFIPFDEDPEGSRKSDPHPLLGQFNRS